MLEAAAATTAPPMDEEKVLLELRPGADGLEALGLLVALTVPVLTVVALALFEPSFIAWRSAIVPVVATALAIAAAVCSRWLVKRRRGHARALLLTDRALIWLDDGLSRRALRDFLHFRYRREPVGEGAVKRWHPRYELAGEDVMGRPVHVELTEWSAGGGGPHGEELAQRVAAWIERGDLEHADVSATLTWKPPEEEENLPQTKADGLAAPAPRWMRISWYLLGLLSPIVSYLWLRERVGPAGDLSTERALAGFFLLFLSLLILQPVIARVMRSRLEMLLVLLGPALALGLPRLLGPGAALDDGAGTPTWMLWLVDMGTVHILTVYLGFAVIAYVASFTTGASRAWDRLMLSVFVMRSVAALVFFVPALLYGRLLVAETFEVLASGPWWLPVGWVLALLSETGTVVQRMVREAAL